MRAGHARTGGTAFRGKRTAEAKALGRAVLGARGAQGKPAWRAGLRRGERGVGRGQRDRRGQGLWASGDQGLEFSFPSKCKGRPLIWVLRRSLWLPCVSKIHSLKRRFPCLSAQGRLQDTVLGLLPGSWGHEKRHAFNVASSAFTDVPPLLCKAFLTRR